MKKQTGLLIAVATIACVVVLAIPAFASAAWNTNNAADDTANRGTQTYCPQYYDGDGCGQGYGCGNGYGHNSERGYGHGHGCGNGNRCGW